MKKCTHYFINVCSLGMGPATVQRIEKSSGNVVKCQHLKYLTWQSYKHSLLTSLKPIELQTPMTGVGRVMPGWLLLQMENLSDNKIYIAPDAKVG
jgi:hypothetical protein